MHSIGLNRIGLPPAQEQSRIATRQNGALPQVQPMTYFAGVTGNLQGRHWLSAEAFQQLLKISPSPYIGKLPTALVRAVPEQPRQVYEILDELASMLQGAKAKSTVENIPINFAFKIGKAKMPVQVQILGSGAYGTAYQLTLNQQSFAFKVYHHPDRIEEKNHGALGECSTGLFLGERKWSDLARFHCANPVAGWGLFELITDEMKADSRPGRSVKTLQLNLDDGGGPNDKNGIRLDYGGITKGLKIKIKTWDDYQAALQSNNPELQADAARQFGVLPYSVMQEAFLLAMQTRDPLVQSCAIEQSAFAPELMMHDLFLLAMRTGNKDVQALATGKIYALPEEQVYDAFQVAMQTGEPKVQAAAAKMIYFLPKALREQAFQQGMQTHHPDVQINAALKIGTLPKSERNKAFLQAMATGNPEIQKVAAWDLSSLPESFQGEAFQQLMNTGNRSVQASAAAMIYSLNDMDLMRKAFRQAVEIQDSAVQVNVAAQMDYLPPSVAKEVFLLAIQTGNPAVQSIAASKIPNLPADFIAEAKQLYIQAMERHSYRHLTDFKAIPGLGAEVLSRE